MTDPYEGSNYDASGMPLGTTKVDYDVKEDVAAKTVFDKPVEDPVTFLDLGYVPRPIEEHLLVEVDPDKYNSAIADAAVEVVEEAVEAKADPGFPGADDDFLFGEDL